MTMRSGGEILVANLVAQRTAHVFGVPGESFLAVLDALYGAREQIALVTCRQEGGAAYMAEAYGKLTGRPGVAIVTRGPGATNAAIGVHVAAQDSTPMLLLVGQVGRDFVDREAFQEVDYRRMYGAIAKWVAQIDDAARIPEYVAHAYRVAMAGRPGPVVLALPEDVLTQTAQCTDVSRVEQLRAPADTYDVARAHALLAAARRPLVLVGGSRWDVDACAALAGYASDNGLPVATAFRRADLFDNRHPNYAGDVGIGINPTLAARVRDADVLLVVGERLGEMTTSGYSLIDAPVPKQTLIHVHPGADELGRVYQPALAIAATPGAFVTALASLAPLAAGRWRDDTRSAHDDYDAWRAPREVPGDVDMWKIVRWLDERLPDDAILANGAGNFATWLHRVYRYRRFGTELAPYAGSMGYGVPAAIAAKLLHPERIVVSWSGDGDFLMNGQELATAMQYGLAVVFVVVDNCMYGTIRMHQEREYPARVHGTDLANPDFAALARAFGLHAETIERTEQFAPAFERALAERRGGLLHVKIDPQALTMSASLDAIRAKAQARTPR